MAKLFFTALKRFVSAAGTVRSRRNVRSMHLCETLPLGDRRYLALVMVEHEKFLVGTTGTSISLLARFPAPFDDGGSRSGAEIDAAFDAEEVKAWR